MGVTRVKVLRKDKSEAIDQTRIPQDDASLPVDIWGELANRIAQIKGPLGVNDPDWKANAPATMADVRAHLDKTAHNPHGTSAAQVGGVTKVGDTGVGPLALAADGIDPFSVVTRRQTVQKGGDTAIGRLRSALSSAPQFEDELVTRAYVDAARAGLSLKPAVQVSSTSNHALTAGLPVMDGVQTQEGWRVLLLGQTDRTQNGLYNVSGTGPWARVADADGSDELPPNTFVFVQRGTSRADSGWTLTTDGPITLGTTPLDFVQYSQAGVILAGAGLEKNGNTLSIGTAAVLAAMLANNILDTSKFVLYRASPLRPGAMPKLRVATLVERDALTGLRNGQGVYVTEDGQDYTVTSSDGSGPAVSPPVGTPASAFKNAGSASSVATTGTSGTMKTDTTSPDPVAVLVNSPALRGYIDGLTLTWDGPRALTVGSGVAYVPGTGRVVEVPNPISLTNIVFAANRFYWIYLFVDAVGAAAIELVDSTLVGVEPTRYRGTARIKGADGSRRYLGAVLTNGDATPGMWAYVSSNGLVRYYERYDVAPFRLASSTVTVSTALSFASVVPVTSRMAVVLLSTTGQAFIHGPLKTFSGTGFTSALNNFLPNLIPLAPERSVFYYSTTGIATIDCLGYFEER